MNHSYPGSQDKAVNHVSFDLAQGETLVLLGSSGSGKSTLLKMANRLIEPTGGQVFVRSTDVRTIRATELRRSIGYVSQSISLFPFLSIRRNLELPLRLRGLDLASSHAQLTNVLDMVRLPTSVLERYPDELSGGQQQRIGVARALLVANDLLLMDEPFGALDAVTRESLQDELLELKQRIGFSMLFVTHDIEEAVLLADRIAILHQGKLEQTGEPQAVYSNPATPFVESLMCRMSRIYDRVAGGKA